MLKVFSITTDESSEFLRQAMKEGFVVTTLVKVLVVGPAGVGKTSLLYLLLSKDPPDQRTSTGCAERAIRVIRIGKESGEWTEIPPKEFEEMIAEAVPVLYEELKVKGEGVEGVAEAVSSVVGERVEERSSVGGKRGTGDNRPPEGKVVEDNTVGEGVKEDEKRELKEESKTQPTASTSKESKKTVGEVIQKLTQLVCGRHKSRRLLDMELIYMTDSGGQQAYWDLIPIFTHDTSATLFVHRLCEKLDEHPLNDLYQRGKQVGPSQRATLTTAQAFKTMLQGLHAGGNQSKIITVGTHRDMVKECDETPEEKNKKFAAIASPHFEDDVIYCNESLAEIVFQVNTKDPDSNDKKEATKIRACIEKGAKQHEIPIWWFILQLILEALAVKLEREVLSKEEVVQVSQTLGFSEQELDAALAFFDKLNIFLYKKAILPGVVFTNAQVPLDKLSKLVEKQYHLRAALADPSKAADQAMSGEWQKFRNSGILTLNFLEDFKEHYVEGIFTAKHFLVLLEKLLVISRLSGTEYFFPAILNMTTEAKIKACLESSKANQIAVLVVEFPTGWAPPGVYCCSVCHLQSHSSWEVVKKPPIKSHSKGSSTPLTQSGLEQVRPPTKSTSSDMPEAMDSYMSRNSIKFTKGDRPGSVIFIDNFSSFAVCVNIDTSKMRRDQLIKHCQAIKSEVFTAIKAALRNTHHEDTNLKMAFLCPQQNQLCNTEMHVARLSGCGEQWICSENREVFGTLIPDQTLWLSASGEPLASRPLRSLCS